MRRPGGRDALRLVEAPDPAPKEGEALVRVEAAGVNYADCMVRMGLYEAARGRTPIVPGFEFAGSIERDAGPRARFRAGDRVFGVARFGAYASKLAVGEAWLWPTPEGWSSAEAAAFPAVFLTAWYGLFEAARLRRGERILVHSAAGGAGTAMLQLARAAGLPAVGVVGSASKLDWCRPFEPEAVIDKSSTGWEEEARRLHPEGYDAVCDANGAETLRASADLLAPGGRLLVYGFASMLARGRERPDWPRLAWTWLRTPRFSPLELTSKNRSIVGFNVVHLFDRADLAKRAMEELLGWAASGRIVRTPVRTFPCAEAGAAHAELESGRTVGKLALLF